jgi:hypothetical protein
MGRSISHESFFARNASHPNHSTRRMHEELRMKLDPQFMKMTLLILCMLLFVGGCTKPNGLSEHSPVVHPRDPNAESNLIAAAVSGDLHRVRSLISDSTNPNAQDGTGRTALMYAVEWDNVECARALVAAGADPTLRNKDGQSANDYSEAFSDMQDALHVGTTSGTPPASSHAPAANEGIPANEIPGEAAAWKKLNGIAPASLHEFIKNFPNGLYRKEVLTYIVMQERMSNVRSGDTRAFSHLLTNTQLGGDWANKGDKVVASGGVIVTGDLSSAGSYIPVGGNATPISTIVGGTNIGMYSELPLRGGQVMMPMVSSDDWKTQEKSNKPVNLEIWPHTGDGAIMGFDSNGHRIGIFGLVIKSETDKPLIFGVVKKFGLVHLSGAGEVVLPDGKLVTFK